MEKVNRVDKKRSSRTLRIIFLVVVIPIVAAYAYLSFVPFDITHKIPELRAKIKPNLYGDIDAKSLSITFLPRPKIYATDFVLTSKRGPVVEAEHMRATVKLIPLIIKRLVIKELLFDEADLFVTKRNDGTINIKEVRKEKLLDIRLRGVKLLNTTLRLVHELPQDTFQIELTNLSAKLYPSTGGYTYIADGMGPEKSIIKISGDASKGKEEWRLGGTMSAEGVEGSLFGPYVRLFDPEIKVKGIIKTDLDFSYHKKATIKGSIDYRGLEVKVPKFRLDTVRSKSGSSQLDLTLSKEELSVALSSATLKMNGFDILGSFRLTGPKKDRSMHLNISSTPGDYFTMKRLVPYKLFSKKVKERIEMFDVRTGRVRIDELKINALMSELKGAALLKDSESFTMKLDFEDFDFKYPGFLDIYSNVWGKLSFKGNDITLTDFSGLYGTAKIEKLDGLIAGLTGKVTYKLDISSSFDLKASLKEVKRLTKGALDKLSGSGPVSLTLHLSGGGGKPLDYLGKVDFLETTLRHTSIPIERFTSTTGSVGFERDMLVFNDISAMSGGSNLTMNGSVENMRGPAPVYNLSLKGALESVGFNSLLKGKMAEPVTYKNLIYYDCKVRGKRSDLFVESTLDLTDIEIAYKKALNKKKDFPVLMKVEAQLNGDKADIKKAIFNIGSSNLLLSGSLGLKGKSYELDIAQTRLKIKDMDNILMALKDDDWTSGSIDLNLKATRSQSAKKTLLNGEVSLTDGFFSSEILKARLEEVNFKALFKGNKADIKIDNVTIGKSSVSGNVTINDLKKRIIDFEINSDYLSTKDLALRDDRAGARSKKKITLTGTGRINIKRGHINKHSFKAFKTKVVIDKDAFHISPLIFSMNKGIITGEADYFKEPTSEHLYNAKLEVRSIDLETMLTERETEKKIVSGKLDADIELFSKRGVPSKEGLNGKISFNTTRGRLWKFPVITKIFSLVNIISINNLFESGLEYNKISGTIDIKDGILFTEDILFDSTSLRMSTYGKIDYPQDSIDATLGFHPFVTVDKLINLIPLAGWIISGKDKSAITMYYEIKGPLKNPDVHAVPVKSLGKGIFGIIERTMTLPAQVLSPGTMNGEKKNESTGEPGEVKP